MIVEGVKKNKCMNNKGISLLEVIVSIAIISIIVIALNITLVNYLNTYKKLSESMNLNDEINIVYVLFNECVTQANKNKEKLNIEILSDEHTMISLEETNTSIEFLYDELGPIYSYYNGKHIKVLNNISKIEIEIDENILRLTIRDLDNVAYKKNYYMVNV